MSDNALWYEKYRPQSLDEYVWFSAEAKKRLTDWLRDPSNMPHLILEGPYGTGKTTLAMLVAKELSLDRSDYLFIDTNKHSGVEAIREDVTNFCELGGWSGLKVVVIDEADGLSLPAQEKLRTVINNYGDYVRFIFTCNKIRGINDGLKSRSRVFTVKELDKDEFAMRLVSILLAEKGTDEITDEEIQATTDIVEEHHPDMRKAILTLQCNFADGQLSLDKGWKSRTEASWEPSLVDTIKNGGKASTIREMTASLSGGEFEGI
jgi:replication factor C small subunit